MRFLRGDWGGQLGSGWAFCGWSTGFRTFFFRVFDYGLHFQWGRELSFSERMGIKNYVRIGALVIRTLKPTT